MQAEVKPEKAQRKRRVEMIILLIIFAFVEMDTLGNYVGKVTQCKSIIWRVLPKKSSMIIKLQHFFTIFAHDINIISHF